jgi:tetratricopeptide (TPR) repeat protein
MDKKLLILLFSGISLICFIGCNNRVEKCNPQLLYETGNYEAAITCADSVIAANSEILVPDALDVIANSQARLGKYKEALQTYSKLIEQYIHDQESNLYTLIPPYSYYIDKARIYTQLGLKDSALKEIATLEKRNPIDDIRGSLFYEKAKIHGFFLDTTALLINLDSVLIYRPMHLGALQDRAKINTLLGNVETAIIDMEKVVELEPNNAALLNFQGIIYAKSQLHNLEALESFSKAMDLEPGNLSYRLNYVKVSFRLSLIIGCEDYNHYLDMGGNPDNEMENLCAEWDKIRNPK